MSNQPSDDNQVDIDAAWAQIIARWDEEAPGRDGEPAGDGSHDQTGRDEGPHRATSTRDTTEPAGTEWTRPARRDPAHRADPEPYDYERDQVRFDVPRPGPRDVDPHGPSFFDGIGASDEEHYEPPPPPPLPRIGLISAIAWIGAVGGPLFLLFCALFWRHAPSIVVAGAVAVFAGGFVTLVLRMSDHDKDDGAVV